MKKLQKIMLSAAVMLTAVVNAGSCNAQVPYSDAIIADAKGNVKAVYGPVDVGGREIELYAFDATAKLVRCHQDQVYLNRDNQGRITLLSYEDPDWGTMTYMYEYNEKGQISKESIENSYGSCDTWVYEYDSNGNIINMKTTLEDGVVLSNKFVYTKFDDKGNWIERTKKQSQDSDEFSSQVEPRRIEYYE